MLINNIEINHNLPSYFIADIGANHDGDLERAKDLIYMAADAGANAAKFQHFKANTIVSDLGFKSLKSINSHQSNWSKSVFEVYKDASINSSWTPTLKETCDKANIAFFTSPYDLTIVDEINEFVPAYKIGSGDISWIKIIEYIASKQKPYILATGAASTDDVYRAVSHAKKINNDLALLQCNTNYTGSEDNFNYINLNVLKTYALMFPDLILGLSDHTPGHSTVLGAIALGARIIEKHFTDDNNRNGPDHSFAMNPQTWKEMVLRSRELELALGSHIKNVENNENDTVILQRRSIRLKRNLKKNDILSEEDIIVLRPCPTDAIYPYQLDLVIGKKLKIDLIEGDYLRWKDIE